MNKLFQLETSIGTTANRSRTDVSALPRLRACSAQRKAPAGATGFTLIEVLVAILVLAIGLLGVAALQTNILSLNTDAYFRTQAQTLVDDLTERMRANWDDGNTLGGYITDFASADADDCNVALYGQTTAARKAEIGCWLEQANAALGGEFTPTLAINAGNANYADIALGWRDREVDTEDQCDNMGASRSWQPPSFPADDPEPPSACFVIFAWSISL